MRMWRYRHLDRRLAWLQLRLMAVCCRLGWHQRAYGGTHVSGGQQETLYWCPGRCGREWIERQPMLTDAQVFERDVLRPLLERKS